MRVVLVVLTVLSPVSVLAQPLGPNWRWLLEPHQSVASGPAIDGDATSRQYSSRPLSGNDPPKPYANVSPDAHDPAIDVNQDRILFQPVAPSGE
jgi:hypothetical protein